MFDKEFFILLIPNIIEAFTQSCLISIFLKASIKGKLIKIFIFSILLVTILEVLNNALPRYYFTLAGILGIFVVNYIIFHSGLLKHVFATALLSLIIVILDLIVTMIFIALEHNHLTSPVLSTAILGKLSFVFLLVIFTFYIYYNKTSLTLKNNFPKVMLLPFLSNILVTFFLILPNVLIIGIYYQKQTLPLSIIFVNIASIILSFFLSIYNTNKNASLIRTEQELEFQINYTSTLENLVDNLKTFKHDFDNTLQLLYGYIEMESMDGLKKTFHQVLDESKTISSLSKINPDKIKNPHLYGLLSAKNNLAIKNNISLDITINADIESIDMQIFDFSRILGIFFDNAIEATQDAKYKKIHFSIKQIDNNIEVLIQNTYNHLALSTAEMFEKGKSSKGDNRGLGLFEVKKLLNKYKSSTLETYIEDCYFCQKLTIPLICISSEI